MTCDHKNNRVFTKRVFGNLSEHYCVQCLKCGAVVKYNGKLWLKSEDMPQNVSIRLFDESLNGKGNNE